MGTLRNLWGKLLPKKNFLRGADKQLLVCLGLIIIFGLIMLSSASSVAAYDEFKDSYHFVKRQILALLIGLFCFSVAASVNYSWLKKHGWSLFLVNLLGLVAVLVIGVVRNGSRAWIPVFGFNLQPSEFLKLTFLLYLAARLTNERERDINKKIVPFLISYSVVAALVVLEPDIGTLFVISAAALVSLFIEKAPIKQIVYLMIAGVLAVSLTVSIFSHQRERFHCLWDASYSPRDKCYQLNQSLIAIGSGGFWGRGLGESRQKYLYIPEVQNDFVFAVIAEEMGFVFSLALIFAYAYLFYRIYFIATHSRDGFAKNLAISIGAWIAVQAFLNIGGVARFLPMTGIPLPFISYGGSSLISLLLAMGVVTNISKNS